ncbi:type II-A CRISPR-associated protein Csn2 [Enterococcus cecorum]|uniref:type II-A CRISPR-associated protein Csn2 n=1 Tax=Enterococcus cecorum TaxID=44008 RepID=UPI003F8DE788
MKIVHPDINMQIDFEDKTCCIWIIESPELLLNYITELQEQVIGNEGKFVLSDENEILSFKKDMSLILSPLEIDYNDKKFINELFKEIKDIVQSGGLYEEYVFVKSELVKLMERISESNDYPLQYSEELEVSSLLKMMQVKFDFQDANYFERLITFVQLSQRLLRKKLLIFVNLSSFLSENQLVELEKIAKYEQIKILLINSYQLNYSFSYKWYIIDVDGSEIY